MIDTMTELAGRRAMREAAPGIGADLDDAQVAVLTRAVALTLMVPRPPGSRPSLVASGDPLDETDVTVLRLMTYALSDAEIARRLQVPRTTLRGRTKRLFAKLGAVSRTQAVAVAFQSGILSVAYSTPESGAVRPPAARNWPDGTSGASRSCEAAEGAPAAFVLSREHRQVLRLLADNLGDQQIAARLSLTSDQVKQRVRALYAITGTSTRTGIAAWGRQAGLVAKTGAKP